MVNRILLRDTNGNTLEAFDVDPVNVYDDGLAGAIRAHVSDNGETLVVTVELAEREDDIKGDGFVIRGPRDDGEQLYWSNEDGWVDRDSATVFPEDMRTCPALVEETGREDV